MATFCLLKDSYNHIFWAKDEGAYWSNLKGGRCPKTTEKIILETIEADDFEDLNWDKTSLCNIQEKGNCGWLSRNGVYYNCGYQEHDLVAYLVLKKEVSELEKIGWVRITDKDHWYCQQKLSAEQRNWLLLNGYAIDEWD